MTLLASTEHDQTSPLSKNTLLSCAFHKNLREGDSGADVSCLQRFLASQGSAIYPEARVSGYFGAATKRAVIRFQETYRSAILQSFGLKHGTGVVQQATRQQIRALIS